MPHNKITTQALVIKRVNYADADRFVTLFSQDLGKISALARGIRKMKSRKRSALEPLNLSKVSLIRGKQGYLLTEAQLVDSFPSIKLTLPRLTQAMQLVEIVDSLTAEEELYQEIYLQLIRTLKLLNTANITRTEVVDLVKFVLDELGFSYPHTSEVALKQHIEDITQRPLRVKKYYLG